MPMISGELKWYTVASTLEQAVYAELTTKPARHSVVPGAIAWDECDCGLLAVSVGPIHDTETFPDPVVRRVGNGCDVPYEAAEIIIQVIRCVPGPDADLAPTTAQLDASAQEILRDAYEMRCAVRTKLAEMNAAREIADYVMRPLTPQGPTGVCGGNELRAVVGLGLG